MRSFGAVELDEKIDIETALLENFVAMEECEAVNEPRIKTVSITLVEYTHSDSCFGGGYGGRSQAKFHKTTAPVADLEWDGVPRSLNPLDTSDQGSRQLQNRELQLQSRRANCRELQIKDLEARLKAKNFRLDVDSTRVFEEELHDCSPDSQSCRNPENGESPCCGVEGCACRHVSQSLCLSVRCDLKPDVCCFLMDDDFNYVFPPCKFTEHCKDLENVAIFETFEVDFGDMCADAEDGTLSVEKAENLETGLLTYFEEVEEKEREEKKIEEQKEQLEQECGARRDLSIFDHRNDDGSTVIVDVLRDEDLRVESVTLREFIEGDACKDIRRRQRQLQRRKKSKGKFNRKKALNRRRSDSSASKMFTPGAGRGRRQLQDVDCEELKAEVEKAEQEELESPKEEPNLLEILVESGLEEAAEEIGEVVVEAVEVQDCVFGSPACSGEEGTCCGSPFCTCNRVSASLCRSEKCTSDEVLDFCCESESDVFTFDFCEDTCNAMPSEAPSAAPTISRPPSDAPSETPTVATPAPTISAAPSVSPKPTTTPTKSAAPSISAMPTDAPVTPRPTRFPTASPSDRPTTGSPTFFPTDSATTTYGTFEVDFVGLCTGDFGGVSLEEKLGMETALIDYFIAVEECEAAADPRVRTVSVTLVEYTHDDTCLDSTTGTGTQEGRGRFHKTTVPVDDLDWDGVPRSLQPPDSDDRRLQSSRNCKSQGLEGRLIGKGLSVLYAEVSTEELHDCSATSDSCRDPRGADSPCCGVDGCVCQQVSQSLCVSARCKLDPDVCCFLMDDDFNYVYPPCKFTEHCEAAENIAIFETFEVDFGGLCADTEGGDLSDEKITNLEEGLLTFFVEVDKQEQCEANDFVRMLQNGDSTATVTVIRDENYKVESVTLSEFIEGEDCNDAARRQRQLQRRKSSKGKFSRKKALNRRRSDSSASKMFTPAGGRDRGSGRVLRRKMQECEEILREKPDLVEILADTGITDIEEIEVAEPVVQDCVRGSPACSSNEGTCCGSPYCACNRVSASLCRSEKCTSEEVTAFCCEADSGIFTFDFCEDTCNAMPSEAPSAAPTVSMEPSVSPTDLAVATYGTLEVEFVGFCAREFGSLLLEETIAIETSLIEYFNAIEECDRTGSRTVSITLVDFTHADICLSSPSSRTGTSRARFHKNTFPVGDIGWDGIPVDTGRRLQLGDCSIAEDFLAVRLSSAGLSLVSTEIFQEKIHDCSVLSDSCLDPPPGESPCCGSEGCVCSEVSQSLCVANRCNVDPDMCCFLLDDDFTYVYPPCKHTDHCKALEDIAVFETFEVNFGGLCADTADGTLAAETIESIEDGLLEFFVETEEQEAAKEQCEAEDASNTGARTLLSLSSRNLQDSTATVQVTRDEVLQVESVTLVEFVEGEDCQDNIVGRARTWAGGRELQRRKQSKGKFNRKKALNRRRSESSLFKDSKVKAPCNSCRRKLQEEQDCGAILALEPPDLVDILVESGLDEVTKIEVEAPVVQDCVRGSPACSSDEGTCCGSPYCACNRVSASLCRSEKCTSDEVLDFCCEADSGIFTFDFCEDTCEAMPSEAPSAAPTENLEPPPPLFLTATHGTFEVEFEGICASSMSGSIIVSESADIATYLKEKADIEISLLEYFNSNEECEGRGAKTVSIALVECRNGRGRFHKNTVPTMPQDTSLCNEVGVVDRLVFRGLPVTSARVLREEIHDCSAFSSSCTNPDNGDSPCCGVEGCVCRHDSQSLCSSNSCNLEPDVCCLLLDDDFTYVYPPCLFTDHCKMLEEQAIYETFEVDFGGLCADEQDGELSIEQIEGLEEGMLTFFIKEEECGGARRILQSSGTFVTESDDNYKVESVTLIEFVESEECNAGRATGTGGRALQRRKSSKGKFQRRKAVNRRRSSSDAAKELRPTRPGPDRGPNRRRTQGGCAAEDLDLVKILKEEGFEEITEITVAEPEVLDCSEGTAACSSDEGLCCGSPGCACARVSSSLCISEKCVSDEVVDFCCEADGGGYTYDFCEDTCDTLLAITEPATATYGTFDVEFVGVCDGSFELGAEEKLDIETSLFEYFNSIEECETNDQRTVSITLVGCKDSRGRFHKNTAPIEPLSTFFSSQCNRLNLVDRLVERGLPVASARVLEETLHDCSAFSSSCFNPPNGESPCCGVEGCVCRHDSQSLCVANQCNIDPDVCCLLLDDEFTYFYPPCLFTNHCKMVEELAIFEIVEVDFGGLCAESEGGELSLDQTDDLEQGLLTFFENEEECEKAESDVTGLSIFDGGSRRLQSSTTVVIENSESYEIESVTLIEFIESEDCANKRSVALPDGGAGRALQRRQTSKGKFQRKKAVNRRRSASTALKGPRRALQQCDAEDLDLVTILQNQGLKEVTDVGVAPPQALDCSEGTTACSSDEGLCCGSPGCVCARVSSSLCLSEKCISDEVVDFCCEANAGDYTYDFCQNTCATFFAPTMFYETFDVEFVGLCDGETTSVGLQDKLGIESALIDHFSNLEECDDTIGKNTVSVTLIECEGGRGRFHKSAEAVTEDVDSSTGQCSNQGLVDHLGTQGLPATSADITDEVSHDCSIFSSSCFNPPEGESPCCGADGCVCRHDSQSLCVANACSLEPDTCCLLLDDYFSYVYPPCLFTSHCQIIEEAAVYETFEVDFGDDFCGGSNGELSLESIESLEKGILTYFENEEQCEALPNPRFAGYSLSPNNRALDTGTISIKIPEGDIGTVSVTLLEFTESDACAEGSGRSGRALQRRKPSKGKFQRKKAINRRRSDNSIAKSRGGEGGRGRRHLQEEPTQCEADDLDLVKILNEEGFDEIKDIAVSPPVMLDCEQGTAECSSDEGVCCGSDGCNCARVSSALCRSEKCVSDDVVDFCCEKTGQEEQPYAFDFCEDNCNVLFPPGPFVAPPSEPKSVQKSVVVAVGTALGVLAVVVALVLATRNHRTKLRRRRDDDLSRSSRSQASHSREGESRRSVQSRSHRSGYDGESAATGSIFQKDIDVLDNDWVGSETSRSSGDWVGDDTSSSSGYGGRSTGSYGSESGPQMMGARRRDDTDNV